MLNEKRSQLIKDAAEKMARGYRDAVIPMYGDALHLPSREAVIEIIRDCQKLLFPVYYGNKDLLKLPSEQYSALLMEHIHEKLTRQIAMTMPVPWSMKKYSPIIAPGLISIPVCEWAYSVIMRGIMATFCKYSSWAMR